MKRKLFRQLMAVSLATAMTASLAACSGSSQPTGGETPASTPAPESKEEVAATPEDGADVVESSEEVTDVDDGGAEAYTVLKDADGNVYDLGGMEIVIRDWWSDGEVHEATNDYEEARNDYREWIQETYNFKIKELAISDWGSAPADFQAYVEQGGDDNNYVFVLRDDPATTASMKNGYMYDLSTLDCLDFSEAKWQRNKLHELYATGSKINCMYPGFSEPRDGMYFNKRLLTDAGVDPESIYDMQKNGTWTWAAFEEICDKVQRDVDNDGTMDITALDANWGQFVEAAVYSNFGEFVGQEGGKYVNKINDPKTVEGLEWANSMLKKYVVRPEDAQWDYYKEAFTNGNYVFMAEQAYVGGPNGFIADMPDDVGFVAMPQGPSATELTNKVSNNPQCIPGCYDADRAWKIAFAYNLYTEDVPGYENYLDLSNYRNYKFDARGVDETVAMLSEKCMVTYHGLIPDLALGDGFVWNINGDAVVSEVIDANMERFNAWVDAANNG